MGGLIAMLSGAPQAASTAGGYYQGAANEIANEYGSPAATQFVHEQNAALRPEFQQQSDALTSQLAGQGIASSGAGRAAFGNLAANQAATLAGAAAPLYQQGLGQYGQIIGDMPQAQTSAYQGSIQDFYGALQSAAAAAGGMPSLGGGGPGANASYGSGPGAATESGGTYYTNSPGSYGDVGSVYG